MPDKSSLWAPILSVSWFRTRETKCAALASPGLALEVSGEGPGLGSSVAEGVLAFPLGHLISHQL